MNTSRKDIQLNDKKTINGWALFDWANSAYALVITTAIFPPYFERILQDGVTFGDTNISNSSLLAFSITTAYLVIAILSPMLSGMADYSGRKKLFLKFFTTMGAVACISLFFFDGADKWVLGTGSFILATIGFAGGLVFYNSYLPEITTEDQYDRVSARGFAFGYVGSVLLLVTNFIIILNYEAIGLPNAEMAMRIAFVMVGIWWLGFAQITFMRLPKDRAKKDLNSKMIVRGYEEIRRVWKEVGPQKNLKRFLIAFFCYSAGVQTVIYLASIFGSKELKMETTELIGVVLILQLVAIGGAYLFAWVSKLKGNRLALIIMLSIWAGICIMAYFVQEKSHFYLTAGLVGLVMGGIQSLSRSTYSKLIPEETEDTASYFSFYDVLEKIAIVSGTFSWGFIEQLTGGMRNSVLAMSTFFIIGILLLLRVKIERQGKESEVI